MPLYQVTIVEDAYGTYTVEADSVSEATRLVRTDKVRAELPFVTDDFSGDNWEIIDVKEMP